MHPKNTIQHAKDWLRKRLDDGAECPVCHQHVQMYKRKLNSGMARSLIEMYKIGGTDWVHLPTQMKSLRSREEGKLRYWGLVEEEKDRREDGGRAGWWRVTEEGKAFVIDLSSVPKYAKVYNGKCYGLEGEPVTIRQCLGDKFNYDALMRGGE